MGMLYAEKLATAFLDELEKIGQDKREIKEAAPRPDRLQRLQERRDPDGIEREKEAAARPKG